MSARVGMKQVYELPLGAGIQPMNTTRLQVRRWVVTVLGPVNFEPSMVRVRMPDGAVRRVFREHLRDA